MRIFSNEAVGIDKYLCRLIGQVTIYGLEHIYKKIVYVAWEVISQRKKKTG